MRASLNYNYLCKLKEKTPTTSHYCKFPEDLQIISLKKFIARKYFQLKTC